MCSFWGQFGPNATTFLLASELFPTDTRGKAHGISAAVGKLGALAADIILGKVSHSTVRDRHPLCQVILEEEHATC